MATRLQRRQISISSTTTTSTESINILDHEDEVQFVSLKMILFKYFLAKFLLLFNCQDYGKKVGILERIGYDPNNRIWDPDFFSSESRRLLKMALSGKEGIDQVLRECDQSMNKSYFYPMIKGYICCLSALTDLNQVFIINHTLL